MKVKPVEGLDSGVASEPPGSRSYVLYAVGVFVTNIGTWMQKVGVGWLTWELTHSAAWVGAITLGDLLGALLVTPWAGAMADRCNPYRFFQWAQCLSIVQSVALWILAAHGILGMTTLFVLTLGLSIIQGFTMPIGAGLIVRLARREHLAQAVAANAFAVNAARAVGPALAGVFLSHHLPGWIFAGNAVSYVLFLGFLLPLKKMLNVLPERKKVRIGSEILDGMKYVFSTPVISRLFAVLLILSFFLRPVIELFPAFAGEVFKGNAAALAKLETAFGLGGLLGGLIMLRLSREKDRLEWLIFVCISIVCGSVYFFSLSASLVFAALIIFLMGIAMTTGAIALQASIQLACAPSLRGRTLSLYQLVFRGVPPLGAFVIGLAAHKWDLPLLGILSAVLAAFCLSCMRWGPLKKAGSKTGLSEAVCE